MNQHTNTNPAAPVFQVAVSTLQDEVIDVIQNYMWDIDDVPSQVDPSHRVCGDLGIDSDVLDDLAVELNDKFDINLVGFTDTNVIHVWDIIDSVVAAMQRSDSQ